LFWQAKTIGRGLRPSTPCMTRTRNAPAPLWREPPPHPRGLPCHSCRSCHTACPACSSCGMSPATPAHALPPASHTPRSLRPDPGLAPRAQFLRSEARREGEPLAARGRGRTPSPYQPRGMEHSVRPGRVTIGLTKTRAEPLFGFSSLVVGRADGTLRASMSRECREDMLTTRARMPPGAILTPGWRKPRGRSQNPF
jgi:hypothetical protein